MDIDTTASQLMAAVEARNVPEIKRLMIILDLRVEGEKIIPNNPSIYEERAKYWDFRQLARKILLNSLYGALLNPSLRFADERLGQSTTLTGRSIVRHMNAKTNETITGEYDYRGRAIVYADTDSCYFSAWEALHDDREFEFDWSNRDAIVELYDGIAMVVNESFPEFMAKTFNTGLKRGAIIKAGRELVASTGLFIKKKKYGLLKYDDEGKRLDVNGSPGKLKAMGLDLKRADTPKIMQKFLEKVLMDVLQGAGRDDIFAQVRQFREDFKPLNAWEKGSPKAVKGLSKYAEVVRQKQTVSPTDTHVGKISNTIPQQVTASMNWNRLCDVYHDKYAMRITDGSRIVICRLRPNNNTRMEAVAYPIDEPHLPDWFKKLPFDEPRMEQIIIDKKLDNLLGVLDWDLKQTKIRPADEFFIFPSKK